MANTKLVLMAVAGSLWGQYIQTPPPNWYVVGVGALAARPATCAANFHVYVCNGAGCTTNGGYHYCTAANVWTVITPTGGAVGGASSLTTVGAIPYVSAPGVLSQDQTAGSQLFWDATNHRLGIGTAVPTERLHVEGSAGVMSLLVRSTDSAAYSNLKLGTDSAPNRGGVAVFGSAFAEAGGLYREGVYLYNNSTGGISIYNEANAPVRFGINNVEQARITLSGFGIGTIAPTNQFAVGRADGQQTGLQTTTELTTILAAATTDTAIQVPANAIVLGVSVRVVTVIPTAATFTVTGAVSATAFQTGASVSTAAGTTDVGTKSCPYLNTAAQSIRITPNVAPAAATGQVRVTIHYIQITAPTS